MKRLVLLSLLCGVGWGQEATTPTVGWLSESGKNFVYHGQANLGDCFKWTSTVTGPPIFSHANVLEPIPCPDAKAKPAPPHEEPEDVEAVTESRHECRPIPDCNVCVADSRTEGSACGCCMESLTVQEPACKDTHSILLPPAEDGKHWCHKPQTKK